jgi:hypothetical protein
MQPDKANSSYCSMHQSFALVFVPSISWFVLKHRVDQKKQVVSPENKGLKLKIFVEMID